MKLSKYEIILLIRSTIETHPVDSELFDKIIELAVEGKKSLEGK